ncbi:MAG: gephyrin-like molybdotransferase Glp [Bacteroidota bacterium]
MISVKEAQEKVLQTVTTSKAEVREISRVAGFVLSRDIYAPLDLPPFDQSAMDGYAIIASDFFSGQKITVAGESAAGKSYTKIISSGQAIRIFTGAEIPKGADAVIMQEKVEVDRNILSVEDANLKPGLNIRTKGSQIKKGALALSKGTLLSPAGIGFLASMGLKSVSVFKKPTISIIVTGNELQKPGTKLSRGNIFESNAITLESALKQLGIENVKTSFVPDNEKQTLKIFKSALNNSDFILFSGGISVGDYDFVGTVLKKEKVNEVFYKVKQKPGKPLYFGEKNKKYIFGLPGNPASVLTCFYEYVLPAIRKFSGDPNCFLNTINLPLSKSIQKKKGLTHFLKATTDFKTVTPMDGQESFIMCTYAEANCLLCFSEESEKINEGEMVPVHLLLGN